MRRGAKVSTERKFFPGYVLVKMNMTDETWHLVKDTAKVTGFLGSRGKAVYPDATLLTRQVSFSINHSVLPVEQALDCHDCHGDSGWVLDWSMLGYSEDPGGQSEGPKYRKKN